MSRPLTYTVDVSIILPIYNAGQWLDETLQSVVDQTFLGSLELSVYLDSCTDNSEAIVCGWRDRLESRGIKCIVSQSESVAGPEGAGNAKNAAVRQSCGRHLCYLDADDIMMPERIEKQFSTLASPNAIVGCRFHRDPEGSTARYTNWANNLSPQQLYTQAYTSHGPTIIMPTWFCTRALYDAVGGFADGRRGVAEDLLFFYKHLEMGGELVRLDEYLLVYRYHSQCTTLSITEDTIWRHRVEFLEKRVLAEWASFTIWNAGKQGRKLYRCLSPAARAKVVAFCDVDEKKLRLGVYTYHDSTVSPKPTVPIVHFSQATPPFIICVKLDLTHGEFEENLASLHLIEGIDYYHFN